MKGKEVFTKKTDHALQREREFAVEIGHLQEQLNVVQIETRELISDPLGAVPNVPFGHLHAAWMTFLEGVGADDELWTFTAPWQTTWGSNEIRTGYVRVRGGRPANHFLTMSREVGDDSTQDSAGNSAGASKKRSSEILARRRKQAD
jgi:hypothetical protein